MVKKSMSVNAIANGLRTVLQVIFPLITYPYVSHILQVENMGKYSFSASIVSYVALFAGLGVETYAVREGAKYRDNKNDFRRFASEVFTINVFSTIVAYIALFVIVEFFSAKLHSYSSLIYTLSIGVIFTTLGCSWIYSIYEEYVYIAIRGIVFQIFSIVLLFTCVKTKEDLLKYAFISVVSSSGSNIVNILGLKRFGRPTLVWRFNLRNRLIPILILFANSLATTIYVNSDTTILGFLSSDYYVGIYSVSTKIYILVKQLLSAIIIVSIPRLSYFYGNNERQEFTSLAKKIINSLVITVLPATVGLFALSKNIVVFISAPSFVDAQYSMEVLSLALVFSLFSWFYTSCILIPAKQEKLVLKATILSAIVNVGLNFALIPLWQERAAALTTVIAEACSLIICFIASKKIAHVLPTKSNLIESVIGCAYIVGVCLVVGKLKLSNTIIVLMGIVISAIGYLLILNLLKNETLNYLIHNLIRKRK